MKSEGFPRLLRLTTVVTMSFFLLSGQIEGQSFSPHSVFEGKYDVQGTETLMKDRNLKAKIEKTSKHAKVDKDSKVGKVSKSSKSKKSQNTFSKGDPSPGDLDFLDFDATTDLTPLDPIPIHLSDKLPCEESLEGDWTYDCGGCDCNKWLVTISCHGAGDSRMCSYVEREYPGDCGLDPEFSDSWASPCTLNGEFRAAGITQSNSTMYGERCVMSLFEPVALETGETCSSEFAQHSYSVKGQFSPAFVGFLGPQSMYLYKSKDIGLVFDSFQIATRISEEMPDDPSFCDSCNAGIASTLGCPNNRVVPIDMTHFTDPPEITNLPTSSPTNAPTKGGINLCNSQVQSIVGFAADSATEIIKLSNSNPGIQAGIGITSGFVSLMYDLACQPEDEPTVTKMLFENVRTIAREQAKEVMTESLIAQLEVLIDRIRIYSKNGGLPISFLISYANEAHKIENECATLGIIGIHPMITAASIKFFLLGLLSEYILLRPDDDLGPCCSLIQDFYESYNTQLRRNFKLIREDLTAYKGTSDNFITEQTRIKNPDNTCPSNCMDYGACCWCSYPYSGYWDGRGQKKAITSNNHCAVTNDSTVVQRIDDLMKRLIKGFFKDLEERMFPQKVLELEASVAIGRHNTLRCST